MSANTDAENRKRKFPHTSHGETRVKPDAPPKPLRKHYKRAVVDTGPRLVPVPYEPFPRPEDYDTRIAWAWILGEGSNESC